MWVYNVDIIGRLLLPLLALLRMNRYISMFIQNWLDNSIHSILYTVFYPPIFFYVRAVFDIVLSNKVNEM